MSTYHCTGAAHALVEVLRGKVIIIAVILVVLVIGTGVAGEVFVPSGAIIARRFVHTPAVVFLIGRRSFAVAAHLVGFESLRVDVIAHNIVLTARVEVIIVGLAAVAVRITASGGRVYALVLLHKGFHANRLSTNKEQGSDFVHWILLL